MPFPISLHTDPRMAAYGFDHGSAPGGRHYFGADRFSAFIKEFLARRLDREIDMIPASPRATLRELTLFHDPEYLADVRTRCMEGKGALDDGLTRAERGMDLAAASVVGAVLHAGKRIVAGETRRGFVPIAGFPHAARDAAHQGAIYNDVAVLIAYLKRSLPSPRIAYVDLDAFFCGALYLTFKADPLVAIADIHQDAESFWSMPGGSEYGQEQTPTAWSEVLQAGVGDEAFLNVWPRMVGWIDAFRPDIVILNAGGSGLRGDGVGGLTYSTAVHKRAALDLMRKADSTAQGRMIVLGGGGHAPWNVAALWCDVLRTMIDGERPEERPEDEKDEILEELRLENYETPDLTAPEDAGEDETGEGAEDMDRGEMELDAEADDGLADERLADEAEEDAVFEEDVVVEEETVFEEDGEDDPDPDDEGPGSPRTGGLRF